MLAFTHNDRRFRHAWSKAMQSIDAPMIRKFPYFHRRLVRRRDNGYHWEGKKGY